MKHTLFTVPLFFISVGCASAVGPSETLDVSVPEDGGQVTQPPQQLPPTQADSGVPQRQAQDAASFRYCYCLDRDGDGLGDPLVGTNLVPTPTGYVHNCEDDNDVVSDGCVSPSTPGCSWFCIDRDNDGEGSWSSLVLAANPPPGYVSMAAGSCSDCSDIDPTVNTRAVETCEDTVDQDCDGLILRFTSACTQN